MSMHEDMLDDKGFKSGQVNMAQNLTNRKPFVDTHTSSYQKTHYDEDGGPSQASKGFIK